MAEEKKNEQAVENAPEKVANDAAKEVKKEKVDAEVVNEENSFKFRAPVIKDYEILLGPVTTEKTQSLSVNGNVITLKVANTATANQVKAAVQAIFGVKVDKVNIVKVLPREKRSTRYPGKVPGFKKAYVKVNEKFNLGEIAKATNTENA